MDSPKRIFISFEAGAKDTSIGVTGRQICVQWPAATWLRYAMDSPSTNDTNIKQKQLWLVWMAAH